MSVQGARAVAYDVLRAVSADEAYANLSLPHAIERAKLDAKDAGLATELTYGTLRRRGTYDAIIAAAADRTVDRIDPAVLDALRLGVHQLLSTRVASHAAVNESVELARRHGGGRGAAGFANAVLRRVSRETPGHWMDRITASARSDDERLGLTSAHPVWIVRAFRRALTAEGRGDELDALLAPTTTPRGLAMIALPGLAEIPTMPVPPGSRRRRSRPRGGDPEALIRESGGSHPRAGRGVAARRPCPQPLPGGRAGGAVARPVRRPRGQDGAARGGSPRGRRPAGCQRDLAHRAGLVRRAVASVPLEVEVTEEDGRDRADRTPGEYDRILVDAPCTGIGALRRRPRRGGGRPRPTCRISRRSSSTSYVRHSAR